MTKMWVKWSSCSSSLSKGSFSGNPLSSMGEIKKNKKMTCPSRMLLSSWRSSKGSMVSKPSLGPSFGTIRCRVRSKVCSRKATFWFFYAHSTWVARIVLPYRICRRKWIRTYSVPTRCQILYDPGKCRRRMQIYSLSMKNYAKSTPECSKRHHRFFSLIIKKQKTWQIVAKFFTNSSRRVKINQTQACQCLTKFLSLTLMS